MSKQGSLTLQLYIQPKSSREGFVGLHGDELKIALNAPPVDGKANQALITFLAKQFRVNKGSIAIISGEQSRHKRVVITAPTQQPDWYQQLERPDQ